MTTQPNATIAGYYAAAAAATGVPVGLLIAQGRQESGFQTDVVSPSGAIGIAQFMPATAAGLGVNPRDPQSSIYGQARLMASYLAQYAGDVAKALAAYNAGPGAVQRYGGVPPYAETQTYVSTILTGWTGQAGATDVTLDAAGGTGTVTTGSGSVPLTDAGAGTTSGSADGIELAGVSFPGAGTVKGWITDALDSAASKLFDAVKPVVIGGVLVAGGVGLIIAGAWRTVSGASRAAGDALEPGGAT
jgi:hypothetical protein